MATKAKNIQKEAAKAVYLNLRDTYTVKEIAETIGIAERTLYDWAKQGEWDEINEAQINSKEAQIKFNYDQLKKLREAIDKTDDKTINSKQADIFAKLIKNIQVLEDKTNLNNTLAVLKEFMLHTAITHTDNLDLIKSAINDFIAHKAKHTK